MPNTQDQPHKNMEADTGRSDKVIQISRQQSGVLQKRRCGKFYNQNNAIMNERSLFRTDTPQKRLRLYKDCLRWAMKQNPEKNRRYKGLCHYFVNQRKLMQWYSSLNGREQFKRYLPELYSTIIKKPAKRIHLWKSDLSSTTGKQARIKALEKAIKITEQKINDQKTIQP